MAMSYRIAVGCALMARAAAASMRDCQVLENTFHFHVSGTDASPLGHDVQWHVTRIGECGHTRLLQSNRAWEAGLQRSPTELQYWTALAQGVLQRGRSDTKEASRLWRFRLRVGHSAP